MRPCTTPALAAYLASSDARLLKPAEAFTFILIDGTTLRYTAWQSDVTVLAPLGDGVTLFTWKADGVKVEGLKFATAVGADVDQQTVQISATADDLVNGVPFLQALRLGKFRGARIRRDRFFLDPGTDAVIGGVPVFWGRMSTIDQVGRIAAQVKVKSDMVVLDIQMPRRLYQASCLNALYDPGCKLLDSAHVVHGTVGSSPTTSVIPWSGASAGLYDLGKVFFESGAAIGEWALVKQSTGSALILAAPLIYKPKAGDAFAVYEGCTKDNARCTALGNLANNVSFPFVPPAEAAF